MTIAFVLSGGGSLGAVQVGMMRALAERDVRPDLLVGTSAGALNASYVAGHGVGTDALDALALQWAQLRRRDLFPLSPHRPLLALTGARESLFASDRLRRLIRRQLPYTRLEDARIPVHVVATNLLTGEEVLLSTGDAVSAVLASTAVPGLLAPVVREGLTLVDGGLANNAPISQALALGADRVYVLPTGMACALARAPARPVATALQALSFLTQQRLLHDVVALADRCALHVVPPLCPMMVSSADFGHARELIEQARIATGGWLDSRGDLLPRQETSLVPHTHPVLE